MKKAIIAAGLALACAGAQAGVFKSLVHGAAIGAGAAAASHAMKKQLDDKPAAQQNKASGQGSQQWGDGRGADARQAQLPAPAKTAPERQYGAQAKP